MSSGTQQVKGYTRKGKNGKTIQVKGYTRKYTKKMKASTDSTKASPGEELLHKKQEVKKNDWGTPPPKWSEDDYQILKETAGMSLWQSKQYLKNRERIKATQKAKPKKRSFLDKLFKRK